MRAFDSRVSEGAVEKGARRANEGTSSHVLSIAGLLSYEHKPRGGGTFAENRLRGGAV